MKKYLITDFEDLLDLGKTCMVTDKITVEGMQVGFMYREQPDDENDSGWRYMSGTEDEDYMSDPGNYMICDINVVANYDKAIIPMVKKPIGSEWERAEGQDYFRRLRD
ncbi:DUF2185 domain-containing protein [Jiulongibacter sp. NS-SX5]|uniref:DUF2185 domain-containing protein n=1 Tax=Jiulongibacter sp. NS-SX5 TaxID=3463854 RepID=UPI0040580F3F